MPESDAHRFQWAVIQRLDYLCREIFRMSAELDALRAEVSRNNDQMDSAIVMIQGLAARIEELKQDPAALQALVDELRANTDQFASDIAANTPSDPNSPPVT